MPADPLLLAVMQAVKGTSYVNDRVFFRTNAPKTITPPYVLIEDVGDASEVFSGAAQRVSYWEQLVQLTFIQKDHVTADYTLPGAVARECRAYLPSNVAGHRYTMRITGVQHIPSPDDDPSVMHAVTIRVTRTLEAI